MALISALIITQNDAMHIAQTIRSIQNFVDEIIVIDSGSYDHTVGIAQSMGALTFHSNIEGSLQQKKFGEKMCKHAWILYINADEQISHGLQQEISYIFGADIQNRYSAYKIKTITIHNIDAAINKHFPHKISTSLYIKNNDRFYTTSTDAPCYITLNSEVDHRIYLLNEPAYSYSGAEPIEYLVKKANLRSSVQSQDFTDLNRKITKFNIITAFFLCFIDKFFLRRYCMLGNKGFIDSVIGALTTFLSLAKAMEKQNSNLRRENDELQNTSIYCK